MAGLNVSGKDKPPPPPPRRMRERGWSLAADGYYGPESAKVCGAFQKEKGLHVGDHLVHPHEMLLICGFALPAL